MSLLESKVRHVGELKDNLNHYLEFLETLDNIGEVEVRFNDGFDKKIKLHRSDFRDHFIEEKKKDIERTLRKINDEIWEIDEQLKEYDGDPDIEKYIIKDDS